MPRYTLRTLLAIVFVLCIGPGGYVAFEQEIARSQRAAVGRIEQLGGIATHRTDPPLLVRTRWWRSVLGDDSFGSTSRVWLNQTAVVDADLRHVARLPRLETLDLGDTRITDAGLVHLRGLTRLEELSLDHTQITDAGLANLKGLRNLRILWLEESRVTHDGIASLRQSLPHAQIH